MSTNYSSIFNLFLTSIKDYNIDALYQSSVTELEDYLTPFLIKGLVNFTNCKKDLEDRDDTTKVFNADLNTDEKVILSNLMLVEWLIKEINDINQMSLHLQDNDFKIYSEERNLTGKRNHLNQTREDNDYQMKKYGFKNLDWTTL